MIAPVGRGFRTSFAAVALLALALIAAPSALGFKYVKVAKTYDEAGDVTATRTAKCPAGKRVLGGGLLNDSGLTPRVQLLDSRPADGRDRRHRPDDAWTASALVESGSPVRITVYAICTGGRAAESLLYRAKSKTFPAESQRGVTTPCPAGSRIVAGGLSSPGGNHVAWITSLAPADGPDAGNTPNDAYAGRLDHYQKADSLKVTVHAVCARGPFGRGLEVHPFTTTTDPPVARTSVIALCDGGDQVVGGGLLSTSGLGNAVFSASAPDDTDVSDPDTVADDGWIGIFENYSQAETLTAYAICG